MKKPEQRTVEFGNPEIEPINKYNDHVVEKVELARFVFYNSPNKTDMQEISSTSKKDDLRGQRLLNCQQFVEYITIRNVVTSGIILNARQLLALMNNIGNNLTGNVINIEFMLSERERRSDGRVEISMGNVRASEIKVGQNTYYKIENDIEIKL